LINAVDDQLAEIDDNEFNRMNQEKLYSDHQEDYDQDN